MYDWNLYSFPLFINNHVRAAITQFLITSLSDCGHLTKYVIYMALWFALGGTSFQDCEVF